MEDAEDFDEKSLFGSDDEEEPPSKEAQPAGSQPVADQEEVDERDLFGSDDEADEKDLFGDEDDEGEAPTAPPSASAPEPHPGQAEEEEIDEREIFGDDLDEEKEKFEDVVILRRPAPAEERAFRALRLPNVLSVEKHPYKPELLHQALEGYKESQNTRGQHVLKLLGPESRIRWRFMRGPEGQILHDDDGRPQYESNSRVVEWEDGSKTLHVGKEVFLISEISDKVAIFEENQQDIHVCHGLATQRLIARPLNLTSQSHEMLKRSQYRKYEPERRSLLSTQDYTARREAEELLREEEQRRQSRPKKLAAPEGSGLTRAFLEDEPDGGEGQSIGELKRQLRGVQSAAKRQRN